MEGGPDVYLMLSRILNELAIELDIHYDDEDFFALTPSMDHIQAAVNMLEEAKFAVPGAVRHVLERYARHRN